MLKRILKAVKGQRGFTLIELLAVIAILGVLAGMVAGAVGGLGATGQNAQIAGDQNAIGTSADRFFNDSFPQRYPTTRPSGLAVSGIDSVALIDFDARLPQDPTTVFVPAFLKQVPDSAARVSWRIDTSTGIVFSAREGAKLVRPSETRLNVSASSTTVSASSDYTYDLTMKKNEAAISVLTIEIPKGYTFNGNPSANTTDNIGTLTGAFSFDNPWVPGQVVDISATLNPTGQANEWLLKVNYPDSVNTPTDSTVARGDRNHTVTVVEPTSDAPGKLTIKMVAFGAGDTANEHNLATENWKLKIYGKMTVGASEVNVIKNPATKAVYRWLAKENTEIDVEGIFDDVSGNQAVIIQ